MRWWLCLGLVVAACDDTHTRGDVLPDAAPGGSGGAGGTAGAGGAGGSAGTGGSGGSIQPNPYPPCRDCLHAQYVVSGMTMPQSDPDPIGCAAPGGFRNPLGALVAALRAASPDLDAQMATDQAFLMGRVIVLVDVEYSPSITDATVAGLRTFRGLHDLNDGLSAPAFYMGGGRFNVTFDGGTGFGGSASGGNMSFGPGDAVWQLAIVPGQTPTVLNLTATQIRGNIMQGSMGGILCGAIRGSDLQMSVLPQIADALSAAVKAQGMNSTIAPPFDLDHSCSFDSNCTPDAPGICQCITASELENNMAVRAALALDLDLDPTATNPFANPNDADYANDALTIGIGFTANSALFSTL